ncbi:MAG TPA: hypothetical protein VN753_04550 [Terracidiphilus sp.]|nr:hypothetical protein [Terracidiphilus sp.]
MAISLAAQKAHRSDVPCSLSIALRLTTVVVALGGVLCLSASMYLIGSQESLTPGTDDLRPGAELAWVSPGVDGQISIGFVDTRVNIEAYNKKRVKEIAEDCRKLLSLAMSLRAEVEQGADSDASPNTIRKADEIEKLAHNLKETMKLNIIGPQ